MKWLLLLLLCLLAACTQQLLQEHTASIAQLEPQNQTIEAPINTAAEPQVNSTEPAPVINTTDVNATPENVSAPVEVPKPVTAPVQTALADQWMQQFKSRYGTYVYEIDDKSFGDMAVFKFANRTKYTSPEHLFEITHDNTVVASNLYEGGMRLDSTRDDIRARKLNVTNYIFYQDGSYSSCFVWSGYYRTFNCIKDNTSNTTPIIYENLHFEPTRAPDEWVAQFAGKDPEKVRYNFTYKDEGNMLHMVDLVYFPYNGTTAVLYLHQSWKIPLKVEILNKENKVAYTYKYKFITTDLSYIKREYPFFVDD